MLKAQDQERPSERAMREGMESGAFMKDEEVRKLRRRIEDVLRKSDAATVLKVAQYLGIKI
jgi:hypothetical protein